MQNEIARAISGYLNLIFGFLIISDIKGIIKAKKRLKKNSNILIAGDFNIIPEEIDVHDFKRYENDALGRLEIRKKYRQKLRKEQKAKKKD